MDLSREELQALATQVGVRADVLERVVRLLKVLARFRADEDLSGAIALKGGTALNVFWLPLPRFSVDIDINFIGSVSAGELAALRPAFEQRVARACQLAGCRVVHSPTQHAGGKFRLRFESLLMGEQNIELDISYVARVPIFDLVESHAMLSGFENELVVTYTLAELAAGKFTALLARTNWATRSMRMRFSWRGCDECADGRTPQRHYAPRVRPKRRRDGLLTMTDLGVHDPDLAVHEVRNPQSVSSSEAAV